MQPIVTRLNPTTNGDLHLGHLYMALVNATEAHNNRGKFILRLDDDQTIWIKRIGARAIEHYSENMVEDLSQFVPIDLITRQSQYTEAWAYNIPITQITRGISMPPIPREFVYVESAGVDCLYSDFPEWISDPPINMYPAAPEYTLNHVIQDEYEGINWLIRGADLVDEFSLYAYFRQLIGLLPMRQTYLPRLVKQDGDQLSPVSKTLGGNSVRELTRIYGVEGVIEILRRSCLINPCQGFVVNNIKPDPRLVLE
jgi:glutamyl/glutaminyl-tRNA synthetase